MWTLVTGGAKNLGAALCLSLAEAGRSVVVHYSQSQREALDVVALCRAKGGQAEAIQGDLSSIENVQEFLRRYLERFPETNGIINNVGDYLLRSASETSIEEWTHLFQLNLHAPFLLTQALAPSLIRNKGNVINIGVSGLYQHKGSLKAAAYLLTKQALLGLTLSLAREWAPLGVRVNMVSPGELEHSVDHHLIPMERPATCSEVCRVVNFLLHPESQYLTGQNIEVAGGLGLG